MKATRQHTTLPINNLNFHLTDSTGPLQKFLDFFNWPHDAALIVHHRYDTFDDYALIA